MSKIEKTDASDNINYNHDRDIKLNITDKPFFQQYNSTDFIDNTQDEICYATSNLFLGTSVQMKDVMSEILCCIKFSAMGQSDFIQLFIFSYNSHDN